MFRGGRWDARRTVDSLGVLRASPPQARALFFGNALDQPFLVSFSVYYNVLHCPLHPAVAQSLLAQLSKLLGHFFSPLPPLHFLLALNHYLTVVVLLLLADAGNKIYRLLFQLRIVLQAIPSLSFQIACAVVEVVPLIFRVVIFFQLLSGKVARGWLYDLVLQVNAKLRQRIVLEAILFGILFLIFFIRFSQDLDLGSLFF